MAASGLGDGGLRHGNIRLCDFIIRLGGVVIRLGQEFGIVEFLRAFPLRGGLVEFRLHLLEVGGGAQFRGFGLFQLSFGH